MSVQFLDNTDRVKNAIEDAIGLSIRWSLEDIYAEATPKTPMNKGDLRTRVLRTMESNSKGVIAWNSNYAGVQEQGYRRSTNGIVHFRNYTTPGTGPHYAENAIKKIVDRFPEYLERTKI